MYGIYTVERYKAELINGEWVRGDLIDTQETRNNLTVDWLDRMYSTTFDYFYYGAMTLSVSEQSSLGKLQVSLADGDWLNTNQFSTPFFTNPADPALGFWTYQGQFDPPGAGQTRYIRSISCAGENNNYVLSVVNLVSPCIQDEFTIVLITYRVYIDTDTMATNGNNIATKALWQMGKELVTFPSATSSNSFNYNCEWYPGYAYLGNARIGVPGEFLEIPSMHETSLTTTSSQEFYRIEGGNSSEFGYIQYDYRTNLAHSTGYMPQSGHLLKSAIFGMNQQDNRKAYRIAIDKGTTSSVQNTYARTAPNANYRLPFLDITNLATSPASVTVTDDGSWAATMDTDFIYDYRIEVTTGGLVGTSEYKYKKRLMTGAPESTNAVGARPMVTMNPGYRRASEDFEHVTMDGSTSVRHGQVAFTTSDSDLAQSNGAANVIKYVFPEILSYDFTGVTITNLHNHAFENIDADSTIALAATRVLQVANDDSTILVACKNTGLYKITRTLLSTSITAIDLVTPAGITAGSGCHGVSVKASGEWWATWNDSTNAKMWLGKSTDSGATWTLYDEGTTPAFAITDYTSGIPGRDNIIGMKVHPFVNIIAAQTHANYNGAGLNGSFAAGTGYSTGLVTMDDGATITIDSVGGGGEVLTFTVTTGTPDPSTNPYKPGDTIPATTGSGFSITPGHNNLVNNLFVLCAPTLNSSAAIAPHAWEDQGGVTSVGYTFYSTRGSWETVSINCILPLSNGQWWCQYDATSYNNVKLGRDCSNQGTDTAATNGWNTVTRYMRPLLIDDLPGDNTTYMVGSPTTTPAATGPYVLRSPDQFNSASFYATLYDASTPATESPDSTNLTLSYDSINTYYGIAYVGQGAFISKTTDTSGAQGQAGGFTVGVCNGTGQLSNDDLCLHWQEYGWNGSAWVEGHAGSRTTHATTETLENGLSVTFDDNTATDPFVLNEYYDVFVGDGILKDSGTTFSQKFGLYVAATSISGSGTSPASVPAADVGAVTSEPGYLLFSGSTSLGASRNINNTGKYYTSWGAPGVMVPSSPNGYMGVFEQKLVGDFEIRFKINSDYDGPTASYRPGLGLATWASAITNAPSGIATSDGGWIQAFRYQLTGVNGAADTVAYNLGTTTNAGSTGWVVDQSVPAGTVSDVFIIRRVGTTIDFLRTGDAPFYTTTNSADLALCCVGYEGTVYDIEVDYTASRRYVTIGNGTTTGRSDPNFRTIAWPTIAADMAVTINGVPATILTDGITAPSSGEVNILPYSGRLWFNSADAGLAITATWRHLLNFNLV